VQVINADGSEKEDASCFTGSGSYEIKINATGYSTALTFTYIIQ